MVKFLCIKRDTWSVHALNSSLKNNYNVLGRTMTTKRLVLFRNASLDEYPNIEKIIIILKYLKNEQ